MPEKYKCPVCGGEIDPDEDYDVNDNHPDGYGEMRIFFDCPHCGAELAAVYEDGGGNNFLRIETD